MCLKFFKTWEILHLHSPTNICSHTYQGTLSVCFLTLASWFITLLHCTLSSVYASQIKLFILSSTFCEISPSSHSNSNLFTSFIKFNPSLSCIYISFSHLLGSSILVAILSKSESIILTHTHTHTHTDINKDFG